MNFLFHDLLSRRMASGVKAAENHSMLGSLRSALVSRRDGASGGTNGGQAGLHGERRMLSILACSGTSRWRDGTRRRRRVGSLGGLVLAESRESWLDLRSGENAWAYAASEMPVYGRFVFLAGPDGDSRGADRGSTLGTGALDVTP